MKTIFIFFFTLTSTASFSQSKLYYNKYCELTIPEMASFYRTIKVDTVNRTFYGIGQDYDLQDNVIRTLYYNPFGSLDSLILYDSSGMYLALRTDYVELEPMRYEKKDYSKKEIQETIDKLNYCIAQQEAFKKSNYFRLTDYPELRNILIPKTMNDHNDIFQIVEEPAHFRGGMPALGQFIGMFLTYPKGALENNISGIVKVKFTVNTDGSASDFEVIEGIGFGCDEEALRVMKLMPDWVPGFQRGTAVKTTKIIPIAFR